MLEVWGLLWWQSQLCHIYSTWGKRNRWRSPARTPAMYTIPTSNPLCTSSRGIPSSSCISRFPTMCSTLGRQTVNVGGLISFNGIFKIHVGDFKGKNVFFSWQDRNHQCINTSQSPLLPTAPHWQFTLFKNRSQIYNFTYLATCWW